nr:Tim44 domain-containing protein [Microvirga flavescens]
MLAVVLTLAAGVAEARMGGGRSSFGSRGARTWSAPPATSTAPNTAAPIQRSQTPNLGPMDQRTVPPVGTAAQPRRFGFGTGLAAGLLGAGLFGMLMGNGFFGGLSGLGSILGLVLQIGLIALLVSFAMKWFRRRQQPAFAGHAYASPSPGPSPRPAGSSYGSALGGLGSQRAQASGPGATRDEVRVGEQDYAAFEKALTDIQGAYSRGDVATIWQSATPEMAGYIQEELNDYASRGLVNSVSDVRLLQGDLAEAWREGSAEYATVAMRYSLVDVTREKASGRVVEGDPAVPTEATEIWTFRRDQGGPWKLSAIQQLN